MTESSPGLADQAVDPSVPTPANPGGGPAEPRPADRGAGTVMEPEVAFTELGQLVIGAQPLGRVLARVAELAKACVPGAEEVSVTLIEGDGPGRTAAFTGSLAASLDERQYEAGFGPCLDAAQTGQTIRVDDTSARGGSDSAYPDFASVAVRQGVHNSVSVGMPMPQRILGGINVYRFTETPLDDDAVRLLQVFAGYAAVAVANHSLYASSLALSANLQTAMQSRAVIEQAKGVIMSRLHCSAEEAFQHLATQSQHTNRKLREIAAEVVGNA